MVDVIAERYKNHPIYRLSRSAVYAVSRIFFRLKVVGASNIPLTGPLIICSNHIHNFDPPVIGACIPRYVHFMAKSEMFNSSFSKWFLPIIGVFPVRRGGQDKGAIRLAVSIPQAGHCLMVFPEGHRSKTGELGEGQPGVAFIARKAHCPILPAAVIGPYKVFRKLTIRFGPPIEVADDVSNEYLVNLLMTEIKKLLDMGHAS